MPEDDAAVVLVVDDEEEVAEVFSLWLRDEYETRVATGGEAALEAIDGVDLVLLDRRMPDLSGDETLARMRERGYDGPVAMVTAVDPDFDIVEMAFDDYLVKPISKEELQETVERLLSVQSYDEQTQDQFALARKLAALEVEKDESELEASEEYATLRRQFEDGQGALDEAFAQMDEQAKTALLKDLGGDRDEPSA
ncbi:MAG TPA: response regulator [Halobacteriales archaeon]|nr:response regulator [Halobacteriales archaeon]